MGQEHWESEEDQYSDYEEVNATPLALPAPGFRPKGLFYQPKKERSTKHWGTKKAIRIEQLQRSDWRGKSLRIRLKGLNQPLAVDVLQCLDRRLGTRFKALCILRSYESPEQVVEAFLKRVEQLGVRRLRPLLSLGAEYLLDVYETQDKASATEQRRLLLEALEAYGPLRYSPYCCSGKKQQVALLDAADWSNEQHEYFRAALADVEELRYLADKKAYRLRFDLQGLSRDVKN